jgi:hypothetical protein
VWVWGHGAFLSPYAEHRLDERFAYAQHGRDFGNGAVTVFDRRDDALAQI